MRLNPSIFRCLLAALCLVAASGAPHPQSAQAAPNPADEYIILSGGPSLMKWELYREESVRHDRWWGNFIRSARIRIAALKKRYPDDLSITWLVYRPAYVSRAGEDGRPLISFIESVRDKYQIKLVWVNSGEDVIAYLNGGQDRRRSKVNGFEYFGHSNKYCFTLDYSNHVLGASRGFIHQNQLPQINKKIFAKRAYTRSWGCHTGESFSKAFRKATGVKMVGAVGKTDYGEIYRGILPFISSPGGYWAD